MKLTRLMGCLLLLGLFSCNQNKVFDQLDTNFPDNRWMKSDTRTYNFTITEAARNYDVVLHLAHIYGYQFRSVPLLVSIKDSDKKQTQKTINLEFVGQDGKDLGDCAGDYCDLYHTLISNEPLPVGDYTLTIAHAFEGEYLPNILGVGIEVMANQD